MPKTPVPLEVRFWSRVEKTNGCWLWDVPRHSRQSPLGSGGGYGVIGRGPRGGGYLYVHRLSYELHKGPIPDGMQVCHTCDVRNCVNPEHLFLGDHSDNMHDAIKKGRIDTRGSGNRMSTITEEIAREIRERFDAGQRPPQIAKELGVSQGVARRVGRRERWRHL